MTTVKMIDITGQRFGRLVAIKMDNSHRPSKSTRAYWLFQCDCGKETIASGTDVRSGKIKSCGCLHDEMASKRFYKHGMSSTKLGYVYESMKQRCLNSNCKDYKNYGGRGITICSDWKNNSRSFFNWAITNGYSDGLSIDRINVNGNYEPTNCRWTTAKVQADNKRPRKCYISKNIRSDNKSGIRGVSFDKSKNKWVASMRFNHQQVLRRTFDTKQEAAQERQRFEKKYLAYV